MTKTRFIPDQVNTFPDERPDACKRSVKVTVVQYRRSDCERTFRQRMEGIVRCGQTRRMRGWEALAWARAVRDGDATLRRLRVEVSGEAAGAVMPPAAGRAVYEQRGGAGGRRKQDKIQYG